MKLVVSSKTVLADTVTPVTAFLRLRDRFPGSLLLESVDYQPGKNALSYLCIEPISTFTVSKNTIIEEDSTGFSRSREIKDRHDVRTALKEYIDSFTITGADTPYEQGVFGFTTYDAVRYFEELELSQAHSDEREIPDLHYQAFRFIVVFNHHKNELTVIENSYEGESSEISIDELLYVLLHSDYPLYPFRKIGEEQSNFTEDQYIGVVEKCKEHIQRGDVFQIVPSRRYSQQYSGDDFTVYRALRSVNPSPYLFYFDYGSFRIFGSSPEAQLVVREGKATLFPIAGTYKRTHDEEKDKQEIERLLGDEKENAEHVMLVDLARNDLSRHCYPVTVESYKEPQSYSHVIHLTSRVSGELQADTHPVDLFADTFPMGTLSGAPKYRAMELLNEYEHGPRRAYGGAIGFFGFSGTTNHAIVIRSFLSKDLELHSQAGGGVVADSVPESEAQEVRNKLAALKGALQLAEEIVS